jgi:hypothetical protein
MRHRYSIRGSAPDPGVFKASRRLNDGFPESGEAGVSVGHTRKARTFGGTSSSKQAGGPGRSS